MFAGRHALATDDHEARGNDIDNRGSTTAEIIAGSGEHLPAQLVPVVSSLADLRDCEVTAPGRYGQCGGSALRHSRIDVAQDGPVGGPCLDTP